MEPLYHDGDLVYVCYTQAVEDGDDVICSTADGAVIKRLHNHKLHSLNKNLPFGEKSEDDHVAILGKVLGIASEDEFASDSVPLRKNMVCCKRLTMPAERIRK